jgi:hypothetical protein
LTTLGCRKAAPRTANAQQVPLWGCLGERTSLSSVPQITFLDNGLLANTELNCVYMSGLDQKPGPARSLGVQPTQKAL